jgi:maltose O-acetyltransferase
VILNVVAVRFSAGTLIEPAVQIYMADHPRDPLVRRSGAEFGRLIAIGRNVWIGDGAIILPGVTIDDDATIRLSLIPRLIELFGLYICLGLPANGEFTI